MPQIIPIQGLKNIADISEKCHSSDTPILITKDGHGDMVIMSLKQYENRLAKINIYTQLEEAESQVDAGMIREAQDSLAQFRELNRV